MSGMGRLQIAIVCLFVLIAPAVSTQNNAALSPVEFVDRAREAGLTAENIFGRADRKDYIIESTGTGVAIFDYDNDGWPDIFIVNGATLTPSRGTQPRHHLYHNNHNGTFTDVTVRAGLSDPSGWGQGVCVGDIDNDGWLDLFRTNFSDDSSTVYRNNHDGTFTDTTVSTGLARNTRYLGWGAAFCDFDNDGWPDLIVANGHVYPEVDRLQLDITYREPKLVYWNRQGKTFRDISSAAGPGITTPASARGLAAGDLWNNGQMEVVIVNMNAAPSLLVNSARVPNHWITLRLIGVVSNAGAIGAQVRLKTAARTLVDEVRSASSYLSVNDQRLHFGLGSATDVSYADVRWPNGLLERFHNLPVDKVSTLKEGTGKALPKSP